MITTLTTGQKQQLNAMNRGFAYGSGANSGFAQFIQDVLTTLSSGEIGIQSNAYDVDSLALGGGAFSQDADTTTGLTFGYFGGSFWWQQSIVQVAAGAIAITASATNYIEVDSSGTVHATTGGFTAGRLPLYEVIASSSSITSWTMNKTLLVLHGAAMVTGAMLTANGASKTERLAVGALTATTTYLAIAPCTGTVSGIAVVCPTAVAANNANYWTVSAVNLGQAGTGSEALLVATAANTTQATGGFWLAANVPQALSLSGTIAVNDGDIIAVAFTATGAPPALTGSALRLKFGFTT